jgi:hypothetical protein
MFEIYFDLIEDYFLLYNSFTLLEYINICQINFELFQFLLDLLKKSNFFTGPEQRGSSN